MIKQYLRNSGTNRRNGVMVAVCIDNSIFIGVSAITPGDTFSPELGVSIAAGRALKASQIGACILPNRYADEIEEFAARCKRYFKDADFAFYIKAFLGIK